MRPLRFAAATLCLLLVVPPTTRAGQITYDIQNYPADQNGHTVSGTITTDGFIGQLAQADITSWAVTFDNTLTFSSAEAGAQVLIQGDVQATLSTLTMAAPTTGVNSLTLQAPGVQSIGNTVSNLFYARELFGLYHGQYTVQSTFQDLWGTANPSMGGTDPWVLAVVPASAVPEPSSLWLLGTAITAGLAYGWSRHRRVQWRQRPVGPPDVPE